MSLRRVHRILLVEDDVELSRTLRELLEDRGYYVAAVFDGIEAVQRLAVGPPPTIVVLDLWLPGLDGEGVIAWMRTHGLTWVPVVVITASGRRPESSVSVIKKPFPAMELVKEIHATLRG